MKGSLDRNNRRRRDLSFMETKQKTAKRNNRDSTPNTIDFGGDESDKEKD